MKLPFHKSTRTFLLWGIGLALVHGAATYALIRLAAWTDDVLFRSNIPSFLMDDRVHVVREFAIAGLNLLHMPLLLTEPWIGAVTAPNLWILIMADALLYGFGTATVIRWLHRPPKLFSRFALPFFTRRTVALALVLAIMHLAVSALIYFGGMLVGYESRRLAHAATDALELLHPWLLDGGLRQYATAHPTVVAIAVLDALAWGVLVAWMLAALRRWLR